jgi:hypothetical protein
MDETLPNTIISTNATLFREEAERARRYAAAMSDKKVVDRLNEIAALYDALAASGRESCQIRAYCRRQRVRQNDDLRRPALASNRRPLDCQTLAACERPPPPTTARKVPRQSPITGLITLVKPRSSRCPTRFLALADGVREVPVRDTHSGQGSWVLSPGRDRRSAR